MFLLPMPFRGLTVSITAVLITALAAACTTPGAQKEAPAGPKKPAFSRPVTLGPETRIIDTRDHFAWSKNRLRRSIYLPWESLSQPGLGARGALRENPQIAADDLARIGIGPGESVVVVGNGSNGAGDEGRVAWVLRWLGVRDVTVMSFDSAFVSKGAKLDSGIFTPEPVAKWATAPDSSMLMTKEQVAQELARAKEGDPGTFVILNVGDEINMPPVFRGIPVFTKDWKSFLDSSGAPTEAAKAETEKLGLPKNRPVLVLSYEGVSSAYIALVLIEWGYDARLLPEGLQIYFTKNQGKKLNASVGR